MSNGSFWKKKIQAGLPIRSVNAHAVLDVSNIRWRTAELKASMFKAIKTPGIAAEKGEAAVASECNPDALDGQAFLLRVSDYAFIKELGLSTVYKQREQQTVYDNHPATIMQQYGFFPLGIVQETGFDDKESLYVLVRGFDHSPVSPFVKNNIYQQILGLVGRHVYKRLSVVLVGIDSAVLNLALNFIYFNRDVDDEDDVVVQSTAVLSIDVQTDDDDIIKNARTWLRVAIFRRASDIHIEPMDGYGRIRLRIDGFLEPISGDTDSERGSDKIPLRDLKRTINWVKTAAEMDPAVRREPSDGSIRFSYTDNNKKNIVDVRISTVPTLYGQKMVLRLLDPDKFSKLAGKGLQGTIWDDDILQSFEEVLTSRDGIVLVTGPTGSGKTTTLNVALRHLLDPSVHGDSLNVVTIEDPIEYSIPGANQTQINERIGMTFARTLRSFLRQDPDIVLVGEIRDQETAQVAVQAALTGHLILATLHTNDALGSLSRLKDLGISPFLIGTTLRLVQAQRLVRRLCPHCGKRKRVEGDELMRKVKASRLAVYADRFADPHSTVFEPSGCTRCNDVGYEDRIAVMEVATNSQQLTEAIEKEVPLYEVAQIARHASVFRPMEESGVKMACRGVTSLAEIETVSMRT